MVSSMKTLLIGLIAISVVAGFAGADGKNYIQPNAGVGVSLVGTHTCPPGVPTPEEPLYDVIGAEIGGVSFCGGHIVPDDAGEGSVSISDSVTSPTSGTYCQDLNDNSLCGEAPVPPDGNRLEPRANFCGGVVLSTPVDLTPRPEWTTNNWVPEVDVLIFVHAPGTGNPANSPCGLTYSGGTTGSVNHS